MTSSSAAPLVSIALPVFNGADTVGRVIESVLSQTYARIELVISDNGSTDGTEEACRRYAREDPRVAYHRHDRNIGLLNNFRSAAGRARGEYLRWIGDDDSLAPQYVERVLEEFAVDVRSVLVTTQIVYVDSEQRETLDIGYDPRGMRSEDAVVRFGRMLRLLTTAFSTIDPAYAMMRRDLAVLPRRNMLREDQVFAARLALSGPWGHVAEPLARRARDEDTAADHARLLGVPPWRRNVRVLLQCRELSHWVRESSLDSRQQRGAHAEIARFYARSKSATARRGVAKIERRVRQPARVSARTAP